jgi:hypothetical protein
VKFIYPHIGGAENVCVISLDTFPTLSTEISFTCCSYSLDICDTSELIISVYSSFVSGLIQ